MFSEASVCSHEGEGWMGGGWDGPHSEAETPSLEADHPSSWCSHPVVVTTVVGTHPTGMHSCWDILFIISKHYHNSTSVDLYKIMKEK